MYFCDNGFVKLGMAYQLKFNKTPLLVTKKPCGHVVGAGVVVVVDVVVVDVVVVVVPQFIKSPTSVNGFEEIIQSTLF